MLATTNKMNPTIESDNVAVPVSSPKRQRATDDERATHSKKQRISRHVTWAEKPEIRQQEDMHKAFSDYDKKEIWYSRHEYDQFLSDRLRTVKFLRASGGNESALDPEIYCVRGLEPFQTADVHQELHSKRQFHQSSILIEQVRQSLLGIRDLERFRILVSTQSEMALRRAQELAALDEHDVYKRVCRRNSLLAAPSSFQKSTCSSSSDSPLSLSLSQRIRRLQEWNARRLMEIYSQPASGNNGPFRFNIRRDSLVGSNARGMGGITMGTRFPIRRDSLTPLSTPHR